MRVLLTGAAGQLGRHLIARKPPAIELITTARSGGAQPCDLSDLSAVRSLLEAVRPDLIINAAAWTAVDAAEEHEQAALRLNRDLPACLAAWAASGQARLISYSTDYVFNGQPGRPWREDDHCDPRSVYGRSKREGELAVLASGAPALLLRTAWVYSALPGNFLSAILGRAEQGQSLKVVADQIGSPTWAGSLADATWALVDRIEGVEAPQLLHVAGRAAMSWHQFARQAVAEAARAGLIPRPVEVAAISSADWPQQAVRPAWSVLDCTRYEQWIDGRLATVDEALKECLLEWTTIKA